MTEKDYDIENELLIVEENTKHKYGQYFTPELIANFMVELADISLNSKVLEPSCGEGVFLEILQSKGFKNLTAYEIDRELGQNHEFVKYESFVSAKINENFDLIIGNPPYIRWKNLEDELKQELAKSRLWNSYFNSLCDYLYIFILKSIELLNENGQLIFICPEYWMNTTHSIGLRNYMVENGYFERIYHFNETPIFNNATVSVVIFKYIKSKNKKETIEIAKYYKNRALTDDILNQLISGDVQNTDIDKFTVKQFEKNKRWLLTDKNELAKIEIFEKNCIASFEVVQDLFANSLKSKYYTIGDVCEIGNGMVSGLDKAFQLNGQLLTEEEKKHTIEVIKAKNLESFFYSEITKYIFVNEIENEIIFKTKFPNFYAQLFDQRTKLEKRYQYNREIHYWQWVFLRNYHLFNSAFPRIFVPSKERISNKDYFRFVYVSQGIFPTQDVTAIFPKVNTKESIHYILAFLNNHRVFDWLKNKGIIKGNIVEFSEKPISSIPFKKINWQNKNELDLHDQITCLTKEYLKQKNGLILNKVNNLLDKLLDKE
jgi:adenine-specific DNA-methyltransferase